MNYATLSLDHMNLKS